MEAAVQAQGVTKRYEPRKGPPVLAVAGIDVTIPQGTLYGFLGPNGAGKTTLMDMIRGYLPPTEGTLRVLGLDIPRQARQLKARLGVSPQEDNLDPDFTVHRNLTIYARYFEIPKDVATRRADDLLEFVGLTEKADTQIDHLSGGMKRRLVLARALINEPDLLVLDEPTTGLDPQARHLVWDKIRQLKRRGLTILLTTHYMEEAERLCDRLAVVDEGKILEEGTPTDLIAKHAAGDVLEITFPGDASPNEAKIQTLLTPDDRLETRGDRILVYTRRADELTAHVRQQITADTVLVRRAGLEDVFLRLTGRDLRE